MTPKQADNGPGTKKNILIIASEILQNQGYDKLSMRKIAKELGFTATSLYFHYENKDEIVFELIKKSRLKLSVFSKDRLKGVKDPLDRILIGFDAFIEYGLNNPAEYRIMFLESFPNQVSNMIKATVSDQIKPGIPEVAMDIIRINPTLKDSALDIANALWMLVHGYISASIISRDDLVFNRESIRKMIMKVIEQIIITTPI